MLIQFLSLSLHVLEEETDVALRLTFPSGVWWIFGGLVLFVCLLAGFFFSCQHKSPPQSVCVIELDEMEKL